MSGLLFGPQKSGRNNGVVVWRGSTVLRGVRKKYNAVLRSVFFLNVVLVLLIATIGEKKYGELESIHESLPSQIAVSVI